MVFSKAVYGFNAPLLLGAILRPHTEIHKLHGANTWVTEKRTKRDPF